MLLPNQLKIGNLILDKNGNIAKIESFGFQTVRLSTENYKFESQRISELTGIKISEKWLYTAGFSYEDGRMWFNKYGIISDYDKKYISMIDREGEHFAVCNYVHELQNLFFSIVGKDLFFQLSHNDEATRSGDLLATNFPNLV